MEILCALLMGVVTSVWRSFVIAKLWGWFVVPIFGLPVISVPVVMGITLITYLCVPWLTLKATSDTKKLQEAITTQLTWALTYLFMFIEGCVIHNFFM